MNPPPATPAAAAAASQPRLEAAWLATAILVGLGLRCLHLDRAAIEHFDEAIYAANFWCTAAEGYQYPFRELYAPPLLPAVIEWLHIGWSVTGTDFPAWLPLVPGLVCGVATIPSVWWICRKWFGSDAGLAAAWLVALNEFHAAYSRTALTDVPVTLAILWAVYYASRTLAAPAGGRSSFAANISLRRSPSSPVSTVPGGDSPGAGTKARPAPIVRASARADVERAPSKARTADETAPTSSPLLAGVVTGVLTAVAWWTKYSGWLPLAILFVGGTVAQLLLRSSRRSVLTWLTAAAAAGGVGLTLWLPVLWDCQDVGGYQAVAANHRGYVQGWTAWTPNLLRQSESYREYAGVFTLLSWFVPAVCLHGALRSWPTWMRRFWTLGPIVLAAAWNRWDVLSLGVAVAAIGLGCAAWKAGRLSPGETAAAALAATWFCGLTLATPMYQAFPRLLLPWWLASVVLAAWLLCSMRDRASIPLTEFAPVRRAGLILWIATSVMMGGYLGLLQFSARATRVDEDRTAYRRVANDIDTALRAHGATDSVVEVYGLPAVWLALRQYGQASLACGGPEDAGTLVADRPWLVVGSSADGDPAWRDEWPRYADRFELIESWSVNPSSIVRLDRGRLSEPSSPELIRLYRRK